MRVAISDSGLFILILFFLTCSTVSASSLNIKSYQYDKIIFTNAKKHKVPEALIYAVIRQESGFDRFAVSHAGAEGLMQLMPATAKRFGVKNSFIAAENIRAGVTYLAWLLKKFNGNVHYALAGYNAGEGRVIKYNGIPPFKETRHYVKKVMQYYREYAGLSDIKEVVVKKSKKKATNLKAIASRKKNKTKEHRIRLARIALEKRKQFIRLQNKKTVNQSRNTPKTQTAASNRIRSVTLAMSDGYSRIRARVVR